MVGLPIARGLEISEEKKWIKFRASRTKIDSECFPRPWLMMLQVAKSFSDRFLQSGSIVSLTLRKDGFLTQLNLTSPLASHLIR